MKPGISLLQKKPGFYAANLRSDSASKILSFKKNETQYTIRLLPIGGYVRMAGEDPDMPELKPGQRVGLLFDENEAVEKIVVNGKDRYTGLRMIETESADLERALVIKGYEEGDDEHLRTFKVKRDAVLVEDRMEMQIAPWDRQFASKSLGKRALTIFAGHS